MSESKPSSLDELWEKGLIDPAGMDCTYCRDAESECRPCCVENREYVPALCNECYRQIDTGGRLDFDRDWEVFMPDAQ